MNPRRHVVDELIKADLIGDYLDLTQVANALEKGEDRDSILYSATLERWPKAFEFLYQRLSD